MKIKLFKKKPVDLRTKFPIEELFVRLPGAEKIFVRTEIPLSWSWFPESVDVTDELMSDYAVVDEKVKDVVQDFLRETQYIIKILEERGLAYGFEDWQESSVGAVREMYEALNRRTLAYDVWSLYAIPYRIRGNQVFRVWAPNDAVGTPIIKTVDVGEFVRCTAMKTAYDVATLEKSNRRANRLVRVLYGIAFIVMVLLWVKFMSTPYP